MTAMPSVAYRTSLAVTGLLCLGLALFVIQQRRRHAET